MAHGNVVGLETSFVCCIEAGLLEGMVVRLVRSLRNHGGRLSAAPFYVSQARLGLPISAKTQLELNALGAQFIRLPNRRRYDWYPYLNKSTTLVALDKIITTEWVTFIDSDILIAREPADLTNLDADFIACAPDLGIIGSTGPDHPCDAAWIQYISHFGLNLDSVPMIREHETGKKIRFYFNSGLFSYRRSTDFAQAYHKAILTCLDAHLGFPGRYEHYTDQVVLGLVALKLGLRWHELPATYNMTVDRDSTALPDNILCTGCVLHYHKALGANSKAFFARLEVTHPRLAVWLRPLGTLEKSRGLVKHAVSETLRLARSIARRYYRLRVHV